MSRDSEVREAINEALGGLSDDEVMYDHPTSMVGPMDPVLFVEFDAFTRAILTRLDAHASEAAPTRDTRLDRIKAALSINREYDNTVDRLVDIERIAYGPLDAHASEAAPTDWHHRCNIAACNCGRCHQCGETMPEPASEAAPVVGLSEAWERAEAALPEGRRLVLDISPLGSTRYRAWAVGIDADWGHSPTEALLNLAARLTQTRTLGEERT